MKKKIFYFYLFTPLLIFAQSGFGEAQEIDILNFQTTKVYAADLDGDGDMDVLISGQNANTIAWYENLDANGTFGSVNYIDQYLNFTQSLSTADFDGDGDQDVLATSKEDDKVVWYENLDGLGDFSTANIIDADATYAEQAKAADIDGDNDLDVVLALSVESKLVWYENLDGLGNFSTEKIITNNAIGVYSLNITDVDGDNFLDVLANSSSIADPAWYKNLDGLGNFGTENIIDSFGTFKIITADIDGDEDIDLVKEHIIDDAVKIHWYENIDGFGMFEQRQLITDIFQPSDIYPEDLDNDGDIDLLITYVGDGKITWFENLDGLGTFGDRKIIEDVASISIFAADIDNDGYDDIITSRDDLINVVWYKNQTYLNIEEHTLQNITLTPNPTSGIIYVEGLLQSLISVVIYDVYGKLLLTQIQPINNFDISLFPTGIYFVKIKTTKGSLVKKIIKE